MLASATQGAAPPEPYCRLNSVVGVGFVSGLDNTGDDPKHSPFTTSMLKSYLHGLGVDEFNVNPARRTIATVLVTAKVPFCETGGESFAIKDLGALDLRLAAMSDATSLDHGVLQITSLTGADGQVYAVGFGPVSTCAQNEQSIGSGSSVHACIAGGGRVVRPPQP